jgi:hypothetical protein
MNIGFVYRGILVRFDEKVGGFVMIRMVIEFDNKETLKIFIDKKILRTKLIKL